MSKESEEQLRESRAPYAATAEVKERIPGTPMATVSPLSPRVRQVVQISGRLFPLQRWLHRSPAG